MVVVGMRDKIVPSRYLFLEVSPIDIRQRRERKLGSVVRVRHEVAGVSVMHARKHAITCCSASSLLPGPAS